MEIFVKLAAGVALVVAGFFVWRELARSRRVKALHSAIRSYVESRGGQVMFQGDAIAVTGPLGAGRERLAMIERMCKPGQQGEWETAIGFCLRKYIPDAHHLALAAKTASRLAELGPQIATLPDQQLRSLLRVRIVRSDAIRTGLAICSRAVGDRFEARVVLDGQEFDGLTPEARARLSESDAVLFEVALAASLPDAVPDVATGQCEGHLWLAQPEQIWGHVPHVIVAVGDEGLAWTHAEPKDIEARLVKLARLALERGPMTGLLWAWDGRNLSCSTVVFHSIRGPNTPDYTLSLPPAFHGPLGIRPGPNGTFGVRMRR